MAGLSKAQILDGIKTFEKKGLPPLEPGGMTYMMSNKDTLLMTRAAARERDELKVDAD